MSAAHVFDTVAIAKLYTYITFRRYVWITNCHPATIFSIRECQNAYVWYVCVRTYITIGMSYIYICFCFRLDTIQQLLNLYNEIICEGLYQHADMKQKKEHIGRWLDKLKEQFPAGWHQTWVIKLDFYVLLDRRSTLMHL